MKRKLEFILKNNEGSFLYEIDLTKDVLGEGSCQDCVFLSTCGALNVHDRIIRKTEFGEWKVSDTDVVCDIVPDCVFSPGFSIRNCKCQKLEFTGKENNFVSFSEEDFMYNEETDTTSPNYFTTSELINVFCKSDFCPIKKKNLECFKTLECPFREVFEKYNTGIAFLPPTP